LRLDLEDIRCWLLEQIDGGEEVKGHDSMLSTYINTIDNALAVLSSETVATVEPRGCPTPGACSCPGSISDAESIVKRATVDTPRTDAATVKMERLDGDFDEVVSAAYARTLERELIDLKQRLLPQFQGRAQRAEHERDALLEQLIIHRTTIANLHGEINKMQNAAPSATAAPDRPDWARQLPGAEIFDRAAQSDHGYDRTASINAGKYVCLCGGTCSHYDAGEKP
jgi:hypothetical protein